MIRTRTALFLALALAASTAVASNDISKVNGSVSAEAGQTYGDLSTVNGSINLGEGAHIEEASTVNGSIKVADGASADSLATVNGSIRANGKIQVKGDAETVNGSIFFDRGSQIGKDVSTVNGSIGLVGTRVGGDVETVTGDVTIGIDSQVRGGLAVRKPKGNFNLNNKRPPRIVIGPNAVVEGPLVFEREVTLHVHRSAKIGPVTGASAQIFDTDTAPEDPAR